MSTFVNENFSYSTTFKISEKISVLEISFGVDSLDGK
jgi:hypothetical protein